MTWTSASWARFRNVIEVTNASAARLSALNGEGVAFLPACWVGAQRASGALASLHLDGLEIVQPVRLVWRGGRPSSRAARRMADLLRSETPRSDDSAG